LSSFILAGNQRLIADHPVIVFFLTMLVGAGRLPEEINEPSEFFFIYSIDLGYYTIKVKMK